jgi:hypothetical protein
MMLSAFVKEQIARTEWPIEWRSNASDSGADLPLVCPWIAICRL